MRLARACFPALSREFISAGAAASGRPGRRRVHVNTRVTAVDASGIVAGGQTVPAATVVWGCRRVGISAAKWLGVADDASGRVVVGPDLSVPGHPEIFAIGDRGARRCAFRNLTGIRSSEPMVMPGVAQPAIQEGKYVSRLILRRVKNRPAPPPFWYWDKGDLAIVGRAYAVADLRFVRFWGFPAWFIWGVRPHLFSDRVCQSRIRAACMGIRFFFEAAARAGS